MLPRERVLAALERKPVDRIPYCEHLVDPRVALASLSQDERTAVLGRALAELGVEGTAHDLPSAMSLLGVEPVPGRRSRRGLRRGPFQLMGLLEPELARLLHRDNITFWGGAGPFEGHGTYLLDPTTPELGASADGVLKTRNDLDKMVFREIEPIVDRAKAFLARKGDLAACALVFLGIDPCWHSMGFTTFGIACLDDPAFVGEVLGPISDWYARVTEALCELDFDFIWAADDIAFHTAPFFSPRVYREVLLPHTRKVAEKITLPWIYHSDGNLLPIWDDLTGQGMNAIHPLEAGSMDIEMLKAEHGDEIAFVGGVDLRILEAGTPEETREEVVRLIRILGPNYGYLLSASNSVTPYVKPENLAAMLDALLEHGRYPLEV
jgi:uroporphyrinogen decarboxylase